MKIHRNDSIKFLFNVSDSKSNTHGKLNYNNWVEFIENQKDYFVWYEETDDGKEVLLNIGKVPEWALEGVNYNLNRTMVYSTNKIVKKPQDFIMRWFLDEEIVKVDIEKKMTKDVAKILLEMSTFLNGKLIINGTKELENIEQLS